MKRLLLTLALAALLVGAADAVTVVDTLPANNQANLTAEAGQTFTTSSLGGATTLASIEIEGPQGPANNMILTYALALYADGDQDHATWDPGALLGTSQLDTVVVGGATLTSFNFSGVSLADNTVYAFKYVDTGGSAVNFARMGLTNANAISDGTLFSAGGQVFGDAFDTAMRITTVPEPGSLAAFGLGVLAMFVRRGRRS
ncbi:MAG: PEP-CTERM sorting domain-containing protein [Planctomycetales bacterium]|nr:PEP-CTERM sorting domain-containing protein [Planctomycetales bacterium]